MSKFDSRCDETYLMKAGGCCAGINMPAALKSQGNGNNEVAQGLPPYHKRQVFLVDEYPACPENWLRSSGRIKSYFVPVIEGNGIWLDFNKCLEGILQHVAINVSVQGINAVTGLKCKNAALEQYKDKCPRHDVDFGPDRFCSKCNYKWPKQNYIASSGTPNGYLWLDGFRAADGVIRQYVMTLQKERGVANAIIGEERVFALGISFYLTKEKRPQEPPAQARTVSHAYKHYMFLTMDYSDDGLIGSSDAGIYNVQNTGCDNSAIESGMTYGLKKFVKESRKSRISPAHKLSSGIGGQSVSGTGLSSGAMLRSSGQITCYSASVQNFVAPVSVKQMEVAAGAKIEQRIYDDPLSLDAYQDEPESIIILNYCSEEECEAILAGGKKIIASHPEGFLQAAAVGN